MEESLRESQFFSVGYDESLNKVAQKTQMDINIRHLDSSTGLVNTKYLTSEFLGSCKAVDLLEHLNKGLGSAKFDKLVSLSMDGPNVNWAMLRDLKIQRSVEFPDAPELIEFGSCALHVVHNALKSGHQASKWSVFKYLRSSYYLFNGFPSRKSQYTSITNSTIFPQKFCVTRWVQNGSSSLKAQEILGNVKKYIDTVEKLPSSKVFGEVKDMLKDPLLSAKLGFFHGLASHLEKFLVPYQSERPMVPFLYDDLLYLIKSMLKRILCKDAYDGIKDASDLFKLNLDSPKVIEDPKNIELFNSAKAGIRTATGKVTAKEILQFRTECLSFIRSAVIKLLDRCLLKYPITKYMSCKFEF